MSLKFKSALQDISSGVYNWRIWLLLAWQDIRLRYRRSILGPFWITISMALSIYSMGFLYGNLFKVDLHEYFPFLATGLLTWMFINTTVNESANVLVEASGYLRQIKIPIAVFTMRVLMRNLIIFVHNFVAIIPIIFFCHLSIGWHTFGLLLGLVVIIANGLVYGLILGVLGARFRDIAQVIISLMQVVFFITPVMWMPRVLPEKYLFIVKYNPFAQFIDLIREPLLGSWPSNYDWMVTIGLCLIGTVIVLFLFARAKDRIIYWL